MEMHAATHPSASACIHPLTPATTTGVIMVISSSFELLLLGVDPCTNAVWLTAVSVALATAVSCNQAYDVQAA